jgi:hypothetical protein
MAVIRSEVVTEVAQIKQGINLSEQKILWYIIFHAKIIK